jgi:hypothetical protein
MAKEPKEYVRKHLVEKRHVDPNTLSEPLIKALNAFSEEEFRRLVDNLGVALTSDPLQPDQKISAVH